MRLKRMFLFVLLVAVLGLTGVGPATADDWEGYLLVTDDQGQPIEGPLQLPDQSPNAMRMTEFHHLVTTDEGTTTPYHKAFIVTKTLDRTSSRLFEAFAEDEHLTVLVKLYSQNQLRFEFELLHARVVAIEPISGSAEPGELERLRFIYERITVRDVSAGTEMVWTLSGWPA